VARRTAELRRFHVIHRPVGNLSSDNEVKKGCEPEKPGQAFNCSLPIKDRFWNLPEAVFPKKNADGDQSQPEKEHGRKNEEDHDSNVWIVHMSTHVKGQDEQPRNACRSHQNGASETQPMKG